MRPEKLYGDRGSGGRFIRQEPRVELDLRLIETILSGIPTRALRLLWVRNRLPRSAHLLGIDQETL